MKNCWLLVTYKEHMTQTFILSDLIQVFKLCIRDERMFLHLTFSEGSEQVTPRKMERITRSAEFPFGTY